MCTCAHDLSNINMMQWSLTSGFTSSLPDGIGRPPVRHAVGTGRMLTNVEDVTYMPREIVVTPTVVSPTMYAQLVHSGKGISDTPKKAQSE